MSSDLKIIDASWYLPGAQRNAREEYQSQHIPGAIFLDIDQVSDPTSPLPHMMPDRADFARCLAEHGISDSDQIVVYDGNGIFSAARMWWMIRMLGHARVFVLDGGLPKWLSEGRAVTADETALMRGSFSIRPALEDIADAGEVRVSLSQGELVLDARASGRFDGSVPEPRAGLKSGHMPGAKNLPFGDLLNPDGTMRAPDELRAALIARGWQPGAAVTTSCGSGVTAAIINLALAVLGERARLYDGSWAEWGGLPGAEVATGAH